jgi:two-component system, NarL family, response regulator YdfI
MIRVQIRASSEVVKAGLESLLQNYPSLHILRGPFNEDESGEGAIADVQPDVVVAELESREDDTTSEVLNAAANGTPVVLLVPGSATEWVDMLQRGIKAVLPANAAGPQIAAATQAAAAGLLVLHPSEAEILLQMRGPNEAPEVLPEALTPREIEVLRLLAEGLGNKEIASRLGVSEHTVKFHVASIMGKLGAESRTEAVMLGIRHGIILI